MEQGREVRAEVQGRRLEEHIDNLLDELFLDLSGRKAGRIAVTGFSFQDNRSAGILNVLNSRAESALANLRSYSVVAPDQLERTLRDNNIDRSDLIDTNTAIEVGELLATDYILTGTVIEMQESVMVFCRVIAVRSATIISVAQVIIPKSSEVKALL